MRKLTKEEQTLWDEAMSSTSCFSTPNLNPPVHRVRRLPVRDISFSPKLDLHHMTLQQAHAEILQHIEQADLLGYKKITHITGKSGQISQEFETWATLHPKIRKIKKLNEGGAWILWLRKK